MPLTATGDIVAAALALGRGVGAFNVIQLESAEAIIATLSPRSWCAKPWRWDSPR